MKNIKLETLDKYKDNSNFELIEGNIYKDLEFEDEKGVTRVRLVIE